MSNFQNLLTNDTQEAYDNRSPYFEETFGSLPDLEEVDVAEEETPIYSTVKADGNNIEEIYVCMMFYERLSKHDGASKWGDIKIVSSSKNLAMILQRVDPSKYKDINEGDIFNIFAYTYIFDEKVESKWKVV